MGHEAPCQHGTFTAHWSKGKFLSVIVFSSNYANLNPMQILNVEIPFYFKNIVDSMNVDFATVGGTAYTVAGSMIIACKNDNILKKRTCH